MPLTITTETTTADGVVEIVWSVDPDRPGTYWEPPEPGGAQALGAFLVVGKAKVPLDLDKVDEMTRKGWDVLEEEAFEAAERAYAEGMEECWERDREAERDARFEAAAEAQRKGGEE